MADVNAPTDRTLSDSFKSPSSAVKEETSVSLSSFLSSPDQQPIRNPLPREAQGPAADTTTTKKEKEWRLKPKNLESNATSDKPQTHGSSNIPNPITTMRPTSPLNAFPSNRPSASPHRSRILHMSITIAHLLRFSPHALAGLLPDLRHGVYRKISARRPTSP
ncbi:hypothetical protein PAAG_12658 [Paracoccidioides lutzii Pb01]|uniref:Uncharacterized protein n=1 Tax=Paracoccidioides lutzii (strain ATCC MYA-826 / Pb01) TaxID=502779 RepID=A0A0A2V3J5_PARBA|nr:hypothetical protein PAAG_12658 [Paracoccidioides lutzii Pb01]KGQ00680.1 hypothetical protein PAAG_12658 [Paracoccidioides lutzii Pb01]